MTGHELKSQVLPSLVAGISRRPLTTTMTPLQALSLAGQALRFEGPLRLTEFALEAELNDRRALVPEAWRRPLIRLLTGKKGSAVAQDPLAQAISLSLERLRLRLHPFDLPRLDDFVVAYSAHLGAQAQAWVQREAPPEEKRGYFEADDLTDATWHLAGFPGKARYIEQRRRQEASAARSLVEAAWPSEAADGRVRLLKALQVGLGNDDSPFLDSLEKDRAPRVRELARRLLSRLGRPGTTGLEACLGRIEKSQAGLLKKRTVLSLKPPATVNDQGIPAWIIETFAEAGLDDLAEAFALSPAELVEASQKDANLLFALLVMATAEGRLDEVKLVMTQGLSQAWEVLALLPALDLSGWSTTDRVRWADLVVQPSTWSQPSSLLSLSPLFRLIESTVSERLMDAILASKAWSVLAQDKEKASSDLLELLTVVCPVARRDKLRSHLEVFSPGLTTRALSFLEILSALEAHA